MRKSCYILSAFALTAMLSACGQVEDQEAPVTSQCVDIPDGQFFQFVDGRLVSAEESDVADRERPYETQARLLETLRKMRHDWVELSLDGRVATVSGIAPSSGAGTDAYLAANNLITTDAVASQRIDRIVNNVRVLDPIDAIADRLSRELGQVGYDWLDVIMIEPVAILTGTAPDSGSRETGYRIGKSTVQSDREADPRVNIVVDAIALDGAGPAYGEALLSLGPVPNAESCQAAFSQTMADRLIEFAANEYLIDQSSSRLLDALVGLAFRCQSFDIVIRGRANSVDAGRGESNLSLERASSVKEYLISYGVPADILEAREWTAEDLEPSSTASNSERRGQRTEFYMRQRPS